LLKITKSTMKVSSVAVSGLLIPCVAAWSYPTTFPTYDATEEETYDASEGETYEPTPSPLEGSPTLEDELSNYFAGGESDWAADTTTSATDAVTSAYSSGNDATTVASETTAAAGTTEYAEDYNEYDATTVAASTTANAEEYAPTTITPTEEEGDGEYSYGSEVTVEEIEEDYTESTTSSTGAAEEYGRGEGMAAAATVADISGAALQASISLFLLGVTSSIIYFS
jgi:hypothetical protein